MNPFSIVLLNLIYKPIFNLIVFLLVLFSWNLWLSIIVLTLLVKLLLLKPSLHANNMSKWMVDIQPRLKEIQEQYKDNPQKLAEESMKLFKNAPSNPLKWCKMLLVQFPILIWLFYVIRSLSLNEASTSNIYSFFYNNLHVGLDNMNHIFFWIDLFKTGQTSWFVLWIVVWVLMYIQISITMLNKPATPAIPQNMPWMPQMPDMTKMMKFMNIFMVFMMITFVISTPAWIWIYLLTSTLFTITQLSFQYKEIIKIKLKTVFSK